MQLPKPGYLKSGTLLLSNFGTDCAALLSSLQNSAQVLFSSLRIMAPFFVRFSRVSGQFVFARVELAEVEVHELWHSLRHNFGTVSAQSCRSLHSYVAYSAGTTFGTISAQFFRLWHRVTDSSAVLSDLSQI